MCLVVMRQGATPVPIPNTTVKTLTAEDTMAKGYGKIGGCQTLLSDLTPFVPALPLHI